MSAEASKLPVLSVHSTTKHNELFAGVGPIATPRPRSCDGLLVEMKPKIGAAR